MHKCAIERCPAEVSHRYIMCKEHWRMVAHDLRTRVLATWKEVRKRQRRLRNEPDRERLHTVLDDYRSARNEAVGSVEFILDQSAQSAAKGVSQ